jgi:hypothetical protein
MKITDAMLLLLAAVIMLGALALGSCGCASTDPEPRREVAIATPGEGGGEGGAEPATSSATGSGGAGGAEPETTNGAGGSGGNAPELATCVTYEGDQIAACQETYPGTCAELGWTVIDGGCPTYSELGCCNIGPAEKYCYYFPAYDYTEAYDLCSGVGTWEGL